MKVIFDLDGTLADIRHRRHFVERPNKEQDWESFFKACVDDKPNVPIIRIFKALQKAGNEMWILSGRSDSVRVETCEWLMKYGIVFVKLVMRPEGDTRPDTELKAEMVKVHELTPNNVMCVFDDRQRLVDMWREMGFTCLQVAEGGF